MARIARIVIPHLPHHVTQRGNRRQRTFFSEQDFHHYLELLSKWCMVFKVQIWAYCLMPNHVHLIAVPEKELGLRKAIGETHRRYTNFINRRENWKGHLWQGRFSSFPMDRKYLLAAARYIEMNPVKAGLVLEAGEYPWSSARAHLTGKKDKLIDPAPLLEYAGDWNQFLLAPSPSEDASRLEKHENTGRPLGGPAFISKLESLSGKRLREFRRGRPPKLQEISKVSPIIS